MAKKKGLLASAATAIAAVGAIGLAGVSSPVGQEVVNAVQNTQVVQKAPQGKKARANQQQTQQQQQRVVVSSQATYLPWRPGDRVYGKFSMTPKEYGEYLMRSGKDKYNKRRRKHWAKAFS